MKFQSQDIRWVRLWSFLFPRDVTVLPETALGCFGNKNVLLKLADVAENLLLLMNVTWRKVKEGISEMVQCWTELGLKSLVEEAYRLVLGFSIVDTL